MKSSKLTRKERRKQGGFIPQYNGKSPITLAEYQATDIRNKLKQSEVSQ